MRYQLYLSQAVLMQTVLLSISYNGKTKRELTLILQYRVQWIQERHLHLSYLLLQWQQFVPLFFVSKKEICS